MYKQLKLYYLYVLLPFLLMLVTAFLFRKVILHTLLTNPHPQINYIIFIIMIAGGVLAIYNVHRLIYESKRLEDFTGAMRSGISQQELQQRALNYDADIAYVLRMIAATTNRVITHQEQIAIESEVDKASKRLVSRNSLPTFLGGLLVGLGLLGTFIGLLATLDDIAVLIASFSTLDMSTADPIKVFGQMVKRMEAPMHSMGVAFSASMYGLFGSILIGIMMVSVKNCMSEFISILGSEVAQHIEHSLSRVGFTYSKTGLMGYGKVILSDEVNEINNNVVVADLNKDVDKNQQKESYFKNENDQIQNQSSVESSLNNASILERIEIRLTESLKLQERSLRNDIQDFQKQRSDLLRLLSESTDATNSFKQELQRVGRQLGALIDIGGKSNDDVLVAIRDLTVQSSALSTETNRLLKSKNDSEK